MDIISLYYDIIIENQNKRFVITDSLHDIPVEMISKDGKEFMLYVKDKYWFYVKTDIENTAKYLTGKEPLGIFFQNLDDVIIVEEVSDGVFVKTEYTCNDFLLPDFMLKCEWIDYPEYLEYILQRFDETFQEKVREYM
ncbi:MAG: hypothetical protein QW607_09490 [Desulfurococcaceae archaeon]